jgi:hypothetical protein
MLPTSIISGPAANTPIEISTSSTAGQEMNDSAVLFYLDRLPQELQLVVYQTTTVDDSHVWRCVCQLFHQWGRHPADLAVRESWQFFPDRAVIYYATRGMTDQAHEAVTNGGWARPALVPALQHHHVGTYYMLRHVHPHDIRWHIHSLETILPIQQGLVLPEDLNRATTSEKCIAIQLAAAHGRRELVRTIMSTNSRYVINHKLGQAAMEGAAEADDGALLEELLTDFPHLIGNEPWQESINTKLAMGFARGGHLAKLAQYSQIAVDVLVGAAAQANQPAVLDYLLARPGINRPALIKEIFREGAKTGHLSMIKYAETQGYIPSVSDDGYLVLVDAIQRDDVVVFEYLLHQLLAEGAKLHLDFLLDEAVEHRAVTCLRVLLSPAILFEARIREPDVSVTYEKYLTDCAQSMNIEIMDVLLDALNREQPREASDIIGRIQIQPVGVRGQKLTKLVASYLPSPPAGTGA